MSKNRPVGYIEDCIAHGIVDGDILEIQPSEYAALLAKYRGNNASTTKFKQQSPCCGNNAMPPITQQIKNVGNALGRVTKAVLTNQKVKASDEEINRREVICAGCEYKNGNRCSKCGCWYEVKITLLTEKCPEKKW